MWKHMNDSDNDDEMFFDDLFGSAEESDEVAVKVSADQSPTENKNEETCKTSSLVDKKKQQKYLKYLEKTASKYVDHDLVNLELTTFKEGWIDRRGKLKESEQMDMVDYRMENELFGGNAVEMEKKKKRPQKKKKRKKSAQKKAKDRIYLQKRLKVFPLPCRYFAEGKCLKGNDCLFLHSLPSKVKKLCKFYLNDECTHRESCNYMHSEFPCKYYHTGVRCFADEDCRFSHAPLTKEMEEVLHAYLNPPRVDKTPKKPDPPVKRECILGVPPEEVRQAEATVEWREKMELLQPNHENFFVKVPPIGEEKAETSVLSSTCLRPKFYQDTLLDSPSPPASPQIYNLFTPLNFYGTAASKIRLGDSSNLPKLSHTLTSGEPSLVDVDSKLELQNDFKKPIKQEVESAPEWIENVSPAINLALQSSTLQIQRLQIKEEPEKKVETEDNNKIFPVIIRVSAVKAEQTSSVHDDKCKNFMQESLPISPKTINQEMTSSEECVESGRKCQPSQSSTVQIQSTRIKEKPRETFQRKENKGMKRNCKLKENATLRAVDKKIKQSEQLKKCSFIPRDNPNLTLPEWPNLTDMLIEIDRQIMTKGNYSAEQINKRKEFHEKLLSTKYDGKKFVKSLPTDIRLMEPRPTPLRKLKLTSPVKEVELQGNSSLTLENDSSASAGGKYLLSAKISDQAKESINFTMSDGTAKPLKTTLEDNKHREAKLPPTRELLLKYKTNQSSFSPNLLNESSVQDTFN